MLTTNQIIRFNKRYIKLLENSGIPARQRGTNLEHCHFMCVRLNSMIDELLKIPEDKIRDQEDKILLWFGFIQGMLNGTNFMTMEELFKVSPYVKN